MKQTLILIPLSFLIATSSHASTPFFPKSVLDGFKTPLADAKNTAKSHDGYADFSGEWVGTCDIDGEREDKLTIEQDLDSSSMMIDHVFFPIDAISTTENHSNIEYETINTHMRWNEDGQKILSTVVYSNKAGRMSQGLFINVIAKVSWSIENAQLMTTNQYSVFFDGHSANNGTFNCIYKKK